jgi:hypothetical protein
MNWVMMNTSKQTTILLSTVMLMLNVAVVQAGSLTNTISNSISHSLATISNSSATSSTNAANDLGQIEGDFKITRIAVDEQGNDRMQIALQAPGADRDKDIYLYIAASDYKNTNLGVGQIVTAAQHPYGVAFTLQGERAPFTVILAEAWVKDLDTRQLAM